MTDVNALAIPPKRRAIIRNIFVQALLVAISGAAFAFAANALSPRGLQLSRDYFFMDENKIATNQIQPAVSLPTNQPPPKLISIPRLDEKKLQAIDTAQAVQFFEDPRRKNGALIFVDARNESDYETAHIPGACELDPYHPDKHLQQVYALCTNAQVVVVYCTGIECDDSEQAALLLRDVGIPLKKIFVYAGGITDWETNNSPLETGSRVNGENSP